jgi:thiamine-monophosphate kinase
MEREFVAWLRKQLPPHNSVELGLGDDAAIVRWASDRSVLSSDLVADGVHFQLDEAGPIRVGRKALAVNLSDLAAMAVRPHCALVSLLLPRSQAEALAPALYEGILPLADQFQLAIVGGDTNCWDGPLVVAITVIGQPTERPPLRRSGARPGDAIMVTGSFGGSILGHHYDFQPRVEESLRLNAQYDIHAAIDVSDGLSLDLDRMCQESQCGAILDVSSVPVSADAVQLAGQDGVTALRHALEDGEDFELILAVAQHEAQRLLADQPLSVPLTQVGQFVAERGLWREEADGTRRPLAVRGYEHGR